MSEPKLCPFRPPYLDAVYKAGKWAGDQVMFAPCLQEKCQMWRVETIGVRESQDPDSRVINKIIGGYCGLAGKP